MRNFQLVLVFFTTLTLFHYAFGESPSVLLDDNSYTNEFYSKAGDEVPWPLIVKPYWVFPGEIKEDQSAERRGNFTEYRISGESVGLWQEIGPVENPRVFKVKIDPKVVQESFEIVEIDFKTKEPVYPSGWSGHFGDSQELVSVGQTHELFDEAAYYVAHHPQGKPSQFLRLVEVQYLSSDEVFLGVSVVSNRHQTPQLNRLFRRIE